MPLSKPVTDEHLLFTVSCSHYACGSAHAVLPIRERIGISKFRIQDKYDALGAAHRPEVRCPFVLAFMNPLKPDLLPLVKA